jgi:hypothetical protein
MESDSLPLMRVGASRSTMTMEFTVIQDFPAGLDCLWAAFGHRDYPNGKYHALGATAVRIHRFSASGEAIEVELERDQPVNESRLPRWARLIVGNKQTLRHRTVWRRVGRARAAAKLDIRVRGLPVQAHAVGVIEESAPGKTRMTLKWCVNSILGNRVERLFADELRAALDDDHAFTLRYLQ